jgi:hypothetical protein
VKVLFGIIQQVLGEDQLQSVITYFLSFLMMAAFFLFYNRIQMTMWLREIEGALGRLKIMKDEARRVTIKTIKEVGKATNEIDSKADRIIEYFQISPVNLDPAGIIWKLEHLMDVRDERWKADVQSMAPAANNAQVNNMENLLEVASGLNLLYRIVRHYYVFGKRTNSLYMIMQLQMLLPLVMQEAEALTGALSAFAKGQPIGDGAGALVAAKLMYGNKKYTVAKDVVAADFKADGRRLLVLKAEGPGGNVGKPGDGIEKLMEENRGKVSLVIMIDAALKLEGEKTGEVSEGIGAAIGGIGVDKYKIEEVTLKYKVPLNAVIIRESIQEAIAPMKKEISEGVDAALGRVKQIIQEQTREGDTVIIAGIGNTIGIGQ